MSKNTLGVILETCPSHSTNVYTLISVSLIPPMTLKFEPAKRNNNNRSSLNELMNIKLEMYSNLNFNLLLPVKLGQPTLKLELTTLRGTI